MEYTGDLRGETSSSSHGTDPIWFKQPQSWSSLYRTPVRGICATREEQSSSALQRTERGLQGVSRSRSIHTTRPHMHLYGHKLKPFILNTVIRTLLWLYENDHCMVCLPIHWHIVTEERLWNIQVTYEERHRHPHMERIPYDSNSLNPGRLFIGHPCEEYVPQEKNKAPRHSSALSGVYKAWVDPAASIPHD